MAKDVYHERLEIWRSYPGLRGRNGAQYAKTLSDEALSSVAFPDFLAEDKPKQPPTEEGVKAFEELRARNKPIAPPAMAAPGFINESDAARVVPKGIRGGLSRLLRLLGALIFWPVLLLFLGTTAALPGVQQEDLRVAHDAGHLSDADYAQRDTPIHPSTEPGEHPDSKYSTFGDQFMDRPDLATYTIEYHQYYDLSANSGLTVLGAGFLWVLGGIFRAKPARILLLRKFNSKEVDNRLKGFVNRYLAPLGHVFVLADKHYKRRTFTLGNFLGLYTLNPMIWGPKLVLIPWDFMRGRFNSSSGGAPIKVTNPTSFRRFGERVADRLSSNAQVISTSRRSIMVRTTDKWWRLVVLLLMRSADLIVIDLSDLTTGTEWELDQLAALNLLERCVFIVRKDSTGLAGMAERFDLWRNHGALSPTFWKGLKSGAAEAQRGYEQLGFKEGDPAPILFKNDGRALAEDDLRERMRAALVAGVRAKQQS